jgi:tetratricopeptide (TPR) repeat protein
LEQAILLTGEYFDRFNRALALSALRDFKQAQQAFDELIAEYPEDSDAYYQRAIVWLDTGQYDNALNDLTEARKLLEAALKDESSDNNYLRGKFADALALFGWVTAGRAQISKPMADAGLLAATESCVQSDWQVPWHVDAMAAAYANVGDFAKAVQWQEDAITRAKDGADLPPLAPERDTLLKLYQEKQRFRLPGEIDKPVAGATNTEGDPANSGEPAAKADSPREESTTKPDRITRPGLFPQLTPKLQQLPRPARPK